MKAGAKAAAQGSQNQKQGTRKRAVQERLHGEVIEWKGAYGWIKPDEKINHAEARKHGARVYVNREDVRNNHWLYEGARVVFYAYADGDGIGAEKVMLEPETTPAEDVKPNGTSGNASAATAERRIPGMPPPAATERRIPGMPPPTTKSRRARAPANTEGAGSTAGASRSAASAASAASGPAASASRSTTPAASSSTAPSSDQPGKSGQPSSQVNLPGQSARPAPRSAPSAMPNAAAPGAARGNPASSATGGGYPAAGPFSSAFANGTPSSAMMSGFPPVAHSARDSAVCNTSPSAMAAAFTSPYGDFNVAGAGHLGSPGAAHNDGAFSCESSVAALAADVAAAVLDEQLMDEQLPGAGPHESKWWQCLAGDCCPISLDPLEELAYEPFGLFGTTDGVGEPPHQGVWGSQAAESVRRGSLQNVHWFNGMFLASFLVSSGQLIDPVNRRQLTRGECLSLDNYLAAHGLPAVHVTDVHDLQQAVSGSSSNGTTDRIRALEREAASMLRSLFDFRSSRSRQPPPPPRSGGHHSRPFQGPGACRQLPEDEGDWPAAALAGRAAGPGDVSGVLYSQRRVHQEGGLTVVDDSEFDEHWSASAAAPVMAGGHDPTPADSLAFNRSGASRPPKAAYPSRGAMAAAAAPPGAGGHIALKSGNSSEAAQVSFSVTGGARAARSTASSSRAYSAGGSASNGMGLQAEESAAPAHLRAFDVWVPDWATPELHQRTLEEVQAVEDMYAGAYGLRTPDVYAHLRDCAHRRMVSTQAEPLCFEVRQHVNGAGASFDCVLEFLLPPYYPVHSATVAIRHASATSSSGMASDVMLGRAVLERLQQVLREEVITRLEGNEVVLPALEWFARRGAGELLRCSQQVAAEQAAATAPPARAAAAASEAETKRERVEQARKDRMMNKYSESWDICNAFKKHGHCNAKNCQWRHELPGSRTWS